MGFFKSKSKSKGRSSRQGAQLAHNSNESNTSSSTTLSTPPRTLQPPPSPPHPAITSHANISTSNLSTTSTLYDQELRSPLPQTQTQTQPQIQQPTPYQLFLSQAQSAARQQQDSAKTQERRIMESRSWPHDPWRGGFGPPAGYVNPTPRAVSVLRKKQGERVRVTGEGGGLNPRRELDGGGGVRGWLEQNGLVR